MPTNVHVRSSHDLCRKPPTIANDPSRLSAMIWTSGCGIKTWKTWCTPKELILFLHPWQINKFFESSFSVRWSWRSHNFPNPVVTEWKIIVQLELNSNYCCGNKRTWDVLLSQTCGWRQCTYCNRMIFLTDYSCTWNNNNGTYGIWLQKLKRVSMGWRLLWVTVKILADLGLTLKIFPQLLSLRLTSFTNYG